MPDDVGGKPFPDGWEPDDDRGDADEDFAPVVFDEDFVRAAPIHEPTAAERLLAAAQARADAEAARSGAGGAPADDEPYEGGHGPGGHTHGDADGYGPADGAGPYGAHGGALRPYRPSSRWHRPVAWILAVVMGVGMVALAFTAVYRGGSGGRGGQVPTPATSGIDTPPPTPVQTAPSASAEYSAPPVPAAPRTP
ncbi:SCO2584 family spore wall biosynthesis protein [Streptomyces sp. NPDC000229]|uniref:SCO2584 family spore wall biosynthesis protein n=1 Tax=Streptomyces sp. NPDC000229 TaxID=3154247 RepID=UPI00331C7816